MFFNNKKVILITLISLFIFSCDENDNRISNTNEIDVDWVLVKTPNMESPNDIGIGYFFFFTNNSNITDMNLEEGCVIEDTFGSCLIDGMILNSNDGILSFTYNEEEFNFDLSSSYLEFTEDEGFYNIDSELEPLQRIIYNQEMNYFTLFGQDGFFGVTLNSSSPNELIDYR